MTDKLRFWTSGGTLLESVGGRVVERDPLAVQRDAEQWSRDALEMQKRGNRSLARLYAHDALEATMALSALEAWKRAA